MIDTHSRSFRKSMLVGCLLFCCLFPTLTSPPLVPQYEQQPHYQQKKSSFSTNRSNLILFSGSWALRNDQIFILEYIIIHNSISVADDASRINAADSEILRYYLYDFDAYSRDMLHTLSYGFDHPLPEWSASGLQASVIPMIWSKSIVYDLDNDGQSYEYCEEYFDGEGEGYFEIFYPKSDVLRILVI